MMTKLLSWSNFVATSSSAKIQRFSHWPIELTHHHEDMSLQSFTYGVPLVVEPVVEKSPIKSPQKRPRVASIKDSDNNNVEQVLNEVSASNPSTPSKTGKRNIYFLDSDTTDRAKNGKLLYY
jgi:hypothetical protein